MYEILLKIYMCVDNFFFRKTDFKINIISDMGHYCCCAFEVYI